MIAQRSFCPVERLGFVAVLSLHLAAPAFAIDSNIANVTLNGVLADGLTVTVNSGSTVNFTLVSTGTANGDVPVSITTAWTLGALSTSVTPLPQLPAGTYTGTLRLRAQAL